LSSVVEKQVTALVKNMLITKSCFRWENGEKKKTCIAQRFQREKNA